MAGGPQAGRGRGVGAVALAAGLLGLGLRLLQLLERRGGRLGPLDLGAGDPDFAWPVLDAAFYDRMARTIAGLGEGPARLVLDEPFGMAPLQGYLLALVYGIAGAEDPTPALLVNALLGSVTVGLCALLAGRLAGGHPRLAAGAAGLMAATWPVAVHYDLTLLGGAPAAMLFTAAALALVEAERAPLGRALLGGALLGLAACARPNLLLALPAAILVLGGVAVRPSPGEPGRRRAALRTILALVLGASLPLGLSTAHNRLAGADFVPVATNGGLNLYMGNNPTIVLEAVQPYRLPAELDAQRTRSRLVASRRVGHWLDAGEADQWWRGQVLEAVRAHPLRYLGLGLRKLHQSLGPDEVGDDIDLAARLRESRVLRWLPLPWLPALVLGLVGAGAARVGPQGRRPWLLLSLVAVGLGSVAIFFFLSRYRAVTAPLVFALAGVGLSWLFQALRARRWASLGLALGLGLSVTGFLSLSPLDPRLPWTAWAEGPGFEPPGPCTLDRHLMRAPRIEAEYRKAKALLLHGERKEARIRLQAIAQADPGHLPTLVDLAAMNLEEGRSADAATLAEQVVAQDPCDEKAWMNLGMAYLRQRRSLDAARALERANGIDPFDPRIEAALGLALLAMGEEGRALRLLEEARRWGPELWEPRLVLGKRALASGDPERARVLLEEALAVQPDRAELIGLHGLALAARGDLAGARADLARAEALGLAEHMAIRALAQGIAASGPGFDAVPVP